MVHLVDKHVKHRSKSNQSVCIENPAKSNIAPEGYMTVEEFRTKTKISLTKILSEHGIC